MAMKRVCDHCNKPIEDGNPGVTGTARLRYQGNGGVALSGEVSLRIGNRDADVCIKCLGMGMLGMIAGNSVPNGIVQGTVNEPTPASRT